MFQVSRGSRKEKTVALAVKKRTRDSHADNMEYKQLFSKWSEEVLTYSTVIGRVWLTVLFFFRVLVLMVGANIFQLDSSRPVVCNVREPGCVEACEHAIFPVIPLRFWSAQLIFASTPTLLYLAYVMHVMYGERMHPKKTDVKAGRTVRRSVACSYFAQLLAKISLEVAFIVMQRDIYGFAIDVRYGCSTYPCPYRVNCYISRATEMTVFSFLMLGVSDISTGPLFGQSLSSWCE
ncbi:hypothetical protein NFI96_003240, partial [Prochilodus magdalenae]